MLTLAILIYVVNGHEVFESFTRVKTCDDTSGTIIKTLKVFSKLSCATLCLTNDSCRSFSVRDNDSLCSFNSATLTDTGCEQNVFKHYNLVIGNPCLHDGQHNEVDDTCQCFYGYVGNRCERLMTDCSEGKDSGHYDGMSALLRMHPPGSPHSFTVWCEMHFGGKTFIMKREVWQPAEDFNRNWTEYKDGFGDMTAGNFWWGLEHLHYATGHRPMLLILMLGTPNEYSPWNHRQRFYYNFRVGPESDNFAASYTSSLPNGDNGGRHVLDDCLAVPTSTTRPFSTIDNDNDNDASNCAATHLSGWWYSNCGGCNPTGKLQPNTDTKQNGDPTFVSMPVTGDWSPHQIHLYLEAP